MVNKAMTLDDDKKYLCEYRYENQTWLLEIPSVSLEEAQDRLKAISNGKILGEIRLTIPVAKGFSKTVERLIKMILGK